MLSVHCPVCLSVTLVHCGQMVGWAKMKLGMQIGLGQDTWGPMQLPSAKGDAQPPIFGLYLLWPIGCMDQEDATWY